MEKITATLIFEKMQDFVERKIPVQREAWIEVAFKLDVLRLDEARLYNKMHRSIGQSKMDIKNRVRQPGQKEPSVTAIEMEIEASEEYELMKNQEDLIYSIDEMIRIAKKGCDINF